MKLTLRIDNQDSLPDGGPIIYSVEGRGLEAGRDSALDWTLPDPSRFISSRHFEVRFEGGVYMLYDMSTNGTFVNDATMRVKSPYQLENGDKFQVGHYTIRVEIGEGAGRPSPAPAPRQPETSPFADFSSIGSPAPERRAPASGDIWSLGGAAPPAPEPTFDPTPRQPARLDDFGSQHIAMPEVKGAESPFGGQAGGQSGGQAGGHSGGQPGVQPAAPPPVAAGSYGDSEILRALCEGAGLRPEALMQGDPAETAREIGRALRIVTEELASLLKARAATKQSVKSGSRTMIGSTDNNPMKFVPSADEALEVMFGAARPGFLRGAAAMRAALDDIKRHQYGVHAAIQPALAQLLEELAPEAIEGKIGASVLSSKKSKAWELYVERWDAMTAPYDNGMLDVFLAYFSEAYDTATRKS